MIAQGTKPYSGTNPNHLAWSSGPSYRERIATEGLPASGKMTNQDRVVAVGLVTVVVALLLVGVVSDTLMRHEVQALPALVAGLVVVFRPAWSRSAAIPVLAFWLLIMVLIWLYLLGLASVVTGEFTPAEVKLTAVIGLAALSGIIGSVGRPARPIGWSGVAIFISFGALQVAAMWLSLQPALEGR